MSADTFTLEDGSQTVYFHDGTVLYAYDAAFVKLTADGQGGRSFPYRIFPCWARQETMWKWMQPVWAGS